MKRYADVTAVDGLDLEVRRGECFGLLGPNGAGKTTTIEILEGLMTPDAGDVEVLGLRWDREPGSCGGASASSCRRRSSPRSSRSRRRCGCSGRSTAAGPSVDELLAMVELESKRAAWFGKLSGGQKQRLAVACALVGGPDLLFLDEPTTGLDPQSRRQLWALLERFRRGGGTVLLTTHYMDEAETLCDRIAIVDRGKVIALGTPRELIASLGAEHVVEFTVSGGTSLTAPQLRGLAGRSRGQAGGRHLVAHDLASPRSRASAARPRLGRPRCTWRR